MESLVRLRFDQGSSLRSRGSVHPRIHVVLFILAFTWFRSFLHLRSPVHSCVCVDSFTLAFPRVRADLVKPTFIQFCSPSRLPLHSCSAVHPRPSPLHGAVYLVPRLLHSAVHPHICFIPTFALSRSVHLLFGSPSHSVYPHVRFILTIGALSRSDHLHPCCYLD